MSEVMVQGVLRMPPELWRDDPIDIAQRHSYYLAAADELAESARKLEEAEREKVDLRSAVETARLCIKERDGLVAKLQQQLAEVRKLPAAIKARHEIWFTNPTQWYPDIVELVNAALEASREE